MIILRQKNYSLPLTRRLAGFNRAVLRKSPMQAKRSAIKTQNKVLGAVANGLNEANKAAINPGQAARRVGQFVAEKPIAAAGVTAGYTVAPIPGTTAASVGLDTAARKYVPAYGKITKRAGEAYGKYLAKPIESVTNVGVSLAKNIAL